MPQKVDEAGRDGPRRRTPCLAGWLPGAARGRATAARTRAGAGDRAVGRLRDDEVVVRLRVSIDRVAGAAGAGDRHSHLALARSDRKAGRAAGAAGVRVGVRVAGLHLADHVASVGLGRAVLSLGALAEEVRQSDRGQDADDQNDDEKLDQSETGLLGLNTCAELPQHVCPPWVVGSFASPRRTPRNLGLARLIGRRSWFLSPNFRLACPPVTRLPYADPERLPASAREALDAVPPLGVFRMMANA